MNQNFKSEVIEREKYNEIIPHTIQYSYNSKNTTKAVQKLALKQ